MINLISKYLLESSLCLIVFVLAYKILIAKSTNFAWMRSYLLASMALGLILPFIVIPAKWSAKLIPANPFPNMGLMQTKQAATTVVNDSANLIQAHPGMSIPEMTLFIAFIVYIMGVIYRSYVFARNLIKINALIRKSPKVKEEKYWVVSLKSEAPAFSFFNCIFMNNTYKNLSANELQLIKQHELVHVKQYHTLDILFAELLGILFWFNPIVSYLKRTLKEIHEYIVDERIAGQGETKRVYAQLLLTLASDTKVFDLAASFNGEHIKRRILMMAKPRTSTKYKLVVFVLVPLTAILLLSFSYAGKSKPLNPKNTRDKSSWAVLLELQKNCGTYLPLKPGPLKIEIQLRNNVLETYLVLINPEKPGTQDPATELNRVSDNKFDNGSIYKNTNNIEFIINKSGQVTGCLFTQREGLDFVTYEFIKRK